MKNIIGSWRFWVIVLLALTTLACAGRAERRERKEEAREERRERAEQRRAERVERAEQRRASGEPAPMTAAERREATRRERAERRQAAREQPQATPVEQAATPAVQTTAAPATLTATSTAASPEASRVVFMRVSKQSSGANASLFDVTEPGAPKFIGNVNAAAKISYPLNPGIYTFMVIGETAEFMQATIVGGKTYYALVIPRAGAKRFAIEPVRSNEIGGKEFLTWDRGTKLMTDTGTAQGFDAAEVAEKRNRYWQDWGKKAPGERAELTINAEDGR